MHAFDCYGQETEVRTPVTFAAATTTNLDSNFPSFVPTRAASPNEVVATTTFDAHGDVSALGVADGGGSAAASLESTYGRVSALRWDGLAYDQRRVTIDLLGRVTESGGPNGADAGYSYDALGRLTKITPRTTRSGT